MALGGGVFVTQNKKLSGAYINFVSASKASATIADRGVCAIPMILNWGAENEVIELTSDIFLNNSVNLLGYSYTDEQMLPFREVFKNAIKCYVYRLNGGDKASNLYATAKYSGVRGNDLSVKIEANTDGTYNVITMLDLREVDTQTVKTVSELKGNDFVTFKSDFELGEIAKEPLTNGTNGTVTGAEWQRALNALQSQSFNTLGVVSSDDEVKQLAIEFTDMMRDEKGVKFQTVIYNKNADNKGIINVVNNLDGAEDGSKLVYWVTGAEAGCQVNKSCSNKVYDGELKINVNHSQSQLENAIDNGEFIFHRVGDEIRVLTDINSKVTLTNDEGEDFKSNQTIRVLDQIANDIATLFNDKYNGKIPNDNAGRISLWSDIVTHHKELQTIRAIENFESENVTVLAGNDKKSVVVNDNVTPTNAMEKLYMTVIVN